MIQVKCIKKFRNKQGKIYGYTLQDITGQTRDVKTDDLKKAILENKISVINLTLTSDNRLIDKEPSKQSSITSVLPETTVKKEPRKSKLEQIAEDIIKRLFVVCDNFDYCGESKSEGNKYLNYEGWLPEEILIHLSIGNSGISFSLECMDEDDEAHYEKTYNEIEVKDLKESSINTFIDVVKTLNTYCFMGDCGEIVINKGAVIKNTLVKLSHKPFKARRIPYEIIMNYKDALEKDNNIVNKIINKAKSEGHSTNMISLLDYSNDTLKGLLISKDYYIITYKDGEFNVVKLTDEQCKKYITHSKDILNM